MIQALDLILSNCDLVCKQALKIGVTQPIFDAKYVRRLKLKEYLPPSILKLEPTKNRVGIFSIGINEGSIFLGISLFKGFQIRRVKEPWQPKCKW